MKSFKLLDLVEAVAFGGLVGLTICTLCAGMPAAAVSFGGAALTFWVCA